MDPTADRRRFRTLVAAFAFTGAGADLAQRGEPQALDEIDRKGLAGQLDAAANHLVTALGHHPRWRAMTLEKRMWAFEAYGGAERMKMPFPSCVHCLTLSAERMASVLLEEEEDEQTADQLSRAISHIQCALFLSQPEVLRGRVAAAEPHERVGLAEAWLRQIEDTAEKTRRLVSATPEEGGL
jgi:hypothetical protein